MENRDLTKVQNQRVDELEAEIQGLINNGCQIQPWLGDRNIVNPSNPEDILGTRVTKNVNVIVGDKLLEKTSKAIEFLRNTSRYITCDIFGNELIAIAHRIDELRGINIIQFSEPNSGSYFDSSEDDAKSKFNKVWGETKMAANVVQEATDDVPF